MSLPQVPELNYALDASDKRSCCLKIFRLYHTDVCTRKFALSCNVRDIWMFCMVEVFMLQIAVEDLILLGDIVGAPRLYNPPCSLVDIPYLRYHTSLKIENRGLDAQQLRRLPEETTQTKGMVGGNWYRLDQRWPWMGENGQGGAARSNDAQKLAYFLWIIVTHEKRLISCGSS